mmetsp:Transcript_20571/g.22930  ORF Transcript_20571/g.22930 Transcript_20571/m.22930 type:complete len:783 (+) Transcript_20571:2-2350(+)
MDSPKIDFDKLVIPDFSEIESDEFKKEVVIPYFKDIYKDLVSRSDKKSSGINKVTIIDYCQLPGILAERFFALLDANSDEYIDLREFVYILFKVYYSSFEAQVKLVFDIYDFDRDGFITKEDVRIILSYIPILKEQKKKLVKEGVFSQEGGGDEDFQTRIKIQEEISELLELAFQGKDKLTLEDFQKFNEEETSDMLVTVLTLLKDKLPCTETFYKMQREFEEKAGNTPKTETGETSVGSPGGSSVPKTIASPRILKTLSPIAKQASMNLEGMGESISYLQKLARVPAKEEDSKGIDDKDIQIDKFKKNKKRHGTSEVILSNTDEPDSPTVISSEVVRMANKNPEPKSLLIKNQPKNIFASPTTFLRGSGAEREEDEEEAKSTILYEGEMMRKAKEDKLKKYWYKLEDKELRAYKHKDDDAHKTMVNLISVFLKIEPEEPLDKKNTLYPFSLLFPNKERTFYLLSKDERDNWVLKIKEAIGYATLTDYYEVKDAVGKGKFGTVKLGIHKKTGKKVAIKVMKKKSMTLQDIELQKREIEILKICQHPSIIRLLDVFENQDYIYIVMEYLSGGPLLQYFKERKYKLKEDRVKDIAHQISTALFYLKSFGIAHRDMKPDNIMMASNTDDGEIKLIDFGLSKIIGPKERSKDPFGTIPYAAPEIILRKPYSHSVDIWSLGVTVFFLMTGFHPFDSHDQQELLKKIVRQEPDWDAAEWKGASKQCKDLVKKLLTKDKEKRIEIEEVLEHEWITAGNEKLRLMRRNSGTYMEKLASFSLTKPEEEEKE